MQSGFRLILLLYLCFIHILITFSWGWVRPTNLYSCLILTFINISLDSSRLLSFEHIIRSTMESVSFSYAAMSFKVPDILNSFLRNDNEQCGYYISNMIIGITKKVKDNIFIYSLLQLIEKKWIVNVLLNCRFTFL